MRPTLLLPCWPHLPAIAQPLRSQAQPVSDSFLSHSAASKGGSSPRGWFSDLLLHPGLLFSKEGKELGRLSGPFHLRRVVHNSPVLITLLWLLGLDINDAVKGRATQNQV